MEVEQESLKRSKYYRHPSHEAAFSRNRWLVVKLSLEILLDCLTIICKIKQLRFSHRVFVNTQLYFFADSFCQKRIKVLSSMMWYSHFRVVKETCKNYSKMIRCVDVNVGYKVSTTLFNGWIVILVTTNDQT